MKIMDLFRRKKDRPVYSHSARVQIWEYIEPIARGESYEDPLDEALCLECQDAEKAFARIEPFLRENPSFQNCRVVVRSGNPALHPREIRLPRHDGG